MHLLKVLLSVSNISPAPLFRFIHSFLYKIFEIRKKTKKKNHFRTISSRLHFQPFIVHSQKIINDIKKLLSLLYFLAFKIFACFSFQVSWPILAKMVWCVINFIVLVTRNTVVNIKNIEHLITCDWLTERCLKIN